mgnify:CR=1 FL=1
MKAVLIQILREITGVQSKKVTLFTLSSPKIVLMKSKRLHFIVGYSWSFTRISTRYDKLDIVYSGFVYHDYCPLV